MPPAAMNAKARRTCTIHRTVFMLSSWLLSHWLTALLCNDSLDSFSRCCQRGEGLSARLVFRVDKSDVGEANEFQNVLEIRLLKIKSSSRRALLVRASTGGDDHDILSSQESLRAVRPV